MSSNDDYEPNSLSAVLARLDAKMDTMLGKVDGHEKRLAYLEKMIWVGAGGGAVAGWLLNQLMKH